MAQKLSHQLRTAEDRIAELECRASWAMAAQGLRRDRKIDFFGTVKSPSEVCRLDVVD
jgi:hypothetical protein